MCSIIIVGYTCNSVFTVFTCSTSFTFFTASTGFTFCTIGYGKFASFLITSSNSDDVRTIWTFFSGYSRCYAVYTIFTSSTFCTFITLRSFDVACFFPCVVILNEDVTGFSIDVFIAVFTFCSWVDFSV